MASVKNELIQVVGNNDGGKTKFILDYVKKFQMQDSGNIVLYNDIDRDLAYGYLVQNQIDDSRFFYNNGISFLLDALDSSCGFNLVVVDSLPMIGKSMNVDIFMQNLRKAVDSCPNLTVIYTNQYRHRLDTDGNMVYPWYSNVISKYTDRLLVVNDGRVCQEYINNSVKHILKVTENAFSSFDSKILAMAQNINEKAVLVCKSAIQKRERGNL